jgi:hypothetical protein
MWVSLLSARMALATDVSGHEKADLLEEISLEINSQWASWVAISGGMGFLLSVYLRTPSPSFHIRVGISGQPCDIVLHVDQDCSARDFLQSIHRTHHRDISLPEALHTFWLCTDSLENLFPPIECVSDSGPGQCPLSSGIPSQIHCTMTGSGNALH